MVCVYVCVCVCACACVCVCARCICICMPCELLLFLEMLLEKGMAFLDELLEI
jgi:hypothetical protein